MARCIEFVAYLWGIETKGSLSGSGIVPSFVAYLWGIETYESNAYIIEDIDVCSLPMRDWNGFCERSFTLVIKFVAYLWGIETLLHQSKHSLVLRVCSLPMRDWNGWKLSVSVPYKKFVAYLWGIETSTSHCACGCSAPFVAYLWGIETLSYNDIYKIKTKVCSLPMRDWNTTLVTTLKR